MWQWKQGRECVTRSWLIICMYCDFFCLSILYTLHLLPVCPLWKRDPSSVALLDVSSIFSLLKGFFGAKQGSKDRGCAAQVVKPLKANLWFVILGYFSTIDLTWLDLARVVTVLQCVSHWTIVWCITVLTVKYHKTCVTAYRNGLTFWEIGLFAFVELVEISLSSVC